MQAPPDTFRNVIVTDVIGDDHLAFYSKWGQCWRVWDTGKQLPKHEHAGAWVLFMDCDVASWREVER